mmetsp:Transcript_61117/g.101661  ORF Transcript_61117/g.101661 Transcript_61117/m.101661 type:complete len:211 (+) Transcript_61117:329-961(+)
MASLTVRSVSAASAAAVPIADAGSVVVAASAAPVTLSITSKDSSAFDIRFIVHPQALRASILAASASCSDASATFTSLVASGSGSDSRTFSGSRSASASASSCSASSSASSAFTAAVNFTITAAPTSITAASVTTSATGFCSHCSNARSTPKESSASDGALAISAGSSPRLAARSASRCSRRSRRSSAFRLSSSARLAAFSAFIFSMAPL